MIANKNLANNQMKVPTEIKELGATWYLGNSETQPLLTCLDKAKTLRHKFICAYDYYEDGMKRPTKVYGSYKNSTKFYNRTKNVESDMRCFYVIIPENTGCCLFADLEWDLDWKTPDQIKDKFCDVVTKTLNMAGVELTRDEYLFANACEEKTKKGSLHAHVPGVYFKNIQEQQRFFNAVNAQLSNESNEWFFMDETEKSFIQKTFIDFGVYNKNRQIRLPYSSKKKSHGVGVRPLLPECSIDEFDIQQWSIVDLEECDVDTPVDVTVYPEEITCNKRHTWSKALVQGILDSSGLDVTVDTFKGSNLITLKNKTSVRKCRINGEDNKSDHAYLVIEDNKLHYRCHDEGCKGQSVIIHEFTENKMMHNEPPFQKYYNECLKREGEFVDGEGKLTKAYKPFLKRFMAEINQYCVIITGEARPYVLYRTETNGSIMWRPKFFDVFVRTYKEYTCKAGRQVLVGPSVFVESVMHKRYLREDCRPYERASDCPSTTFNIYQGLAIGKDQALCKGQSDPDKLLDFLLVNWCRDDQDLFDWVMNWMAHLIQKPWVKMKTSIVLKGSEGSGKGMIVQILSKIIGDMHYFQPSSHEDMFGNFNYMMDNRLLVFADEMIWGGNKKEAGQLKKLLTENTRCSNTKYGPIRRMSNMINWIFASNEDWVIPAGARARRYTVLDVANGLYSMTSDERKELYDFCPYSFAKYLYNRDIEGFNPHEMYNTQALADQKIRSMSDEHSFWMDYVQENSHDFGNWISKDNLYEQFCEVNKTRRYKPTKKVFFANLRKLHPLEEKRGSTRYLRKRIIQLPDHKDAIDTFNRHYDHQMIDPSDFKEQDNGEIDKI